MWVRADDGCVVRDAGVETVRVRADNGCVVCGAVWVRADDGCEVRDAGVETVWVRADDGCVVRGAGVETVWVRADDGCVVRAVFKSAGFEVMCFRGLRTLTKGKRASHDYFNNGN